MRPSAAMRQRLDGWRAAQGWASPVVGVHIRRSDKLTDEARFHDDDEYLRQAELFCDQHLPSGWQQSARAQRERPDAGGAVPPRCSVYIATDDPGAVDDIRASHPHLHVMTNPHGLETGARARPLPSSRELRRRGWQRPVARSPRPTTPPPG